MEGEISQTSTKRKEKLWHLSRQIHKAWINFAVCNVYNVQHSYWTFENLELLTNIMLWHLKYFLAIIIIKSKKQ